MSRPTSPLPATWGTDTGRRTTPSTSKQGSGFAPAERPGNGVLNWLIGSLIGAWVSYLASSRTRNYHPVILFSGSNPWTYSSAGAITSPASSPGISQFSIPTENGETITSIEFNVAGNGTTDVTYTLVKVNAGGTTTTLGTLTDTNRSSTPATITLDASTGLPITIAAGDTLYVNVSSNGSGYFITRITLNP